MMFTEQERTIISAMNPFRYEDNYTEIFMTVWFEEIDMALDFVASPLDTERHGKELWIRAMAGEFGPIEVFPEEQSPIKKMEQNHKLRQKLLAQDRSPKLLTYDRHDEIPKKKSKKSAKKAVRA